VATLLRDNGGISVTDNVVEIGTFNLASGKYMDGQMDDIRVFDYELTADNVTALALDTFDDAAVTPALSSSSAVATTYTTGDTIPITNTWSFEPYWDGGVPYYTIESAETDLVIRFSYKDGVTQYDISDEIQAGMRTLDMDYKDANITLPSGCGLTGVGDDAATLTLPVGGIDNTTIIAAPGAWTIPGGYADYATLLTAHGYLIGNDTIEVFDNANITITDEDGVASNPIVIYLRAGYSGTLDLNSNDYINVFAHPAATVSNAAGADVVVTKFNGAAGL
jgi:hypothetical protein